MTPDQKLDDVRDTLHEMKPMLSTLIKATDGLEIRTRSLEVAQGEHGVKIERAQQDLDALGRKVRYQKDDMPPRSGGERKWLTILEFLVDAPKWIHAAVTVGSLVTLALTIFLRRHNG